VVGGGLRLSPGSRQGVGQDPDGAWNSRDGKRPSRRDRLGGRHDAAEVRHESYERCDASSRSDRSAETRAQRGGYKQDLRPEEFTVAVMKDLEEDLFETGYAMSARTLTASRVDLGRRSQQMNGRWHSLKSLLAS
jgi:hypothetical protein